MTAQLRQILEALQAVVAQVPGVATAYVGINEALPQTPAVEIIQGPYEFEPPGFQGVGQPIEHLMFQLAIFVQLSPNSSDDELELLAIQQGIADAFGDPAFDYTLGGLVDTTYLLGGDSDVALRGSRKFRSAVIVGRAGEPE